MIYRFGNHIRDTFNLKNASTPGPQYNIERAYQAYVGKRSPRHSIAIKYKNIIEASKTPGPGAYLNLLTAERDKKGITISQKFKFGSIINVDEASRQPGPGQYHLDNSSQAMSNTAKHVGPKFTFPRQERSIDKKDSNSFPDPASYTPKLNSGAPRITYVLKFISNSNRIAIKTNTSSSTKLDTPGPGSYHL